MSDGAKFNARNPAVKRILQEVREIQRENNPDIMAQALEDNIFEWHFAIRGPPDTEFAGGIYHGRLLMPPDYPFKPPSFMLLTPNGRFETGTKICLSISSHHPEHWQPSWCRYSPVSLLFLHAHVQLQELKDFPKDERRRLAEKSRLEPPLFGSPVRQEVTKSVHQQMLAAEDSPSAAQGKGGAESSGAEFLDERAPSDMAAESAQRPAAATAYLPTLFDQPAQQQPLRVVRSDWEDKSLGLLAAALSIAIIAILGRRLLIIADIDIADFF